MQLDECWRHGDDSRVEIVEHIQQELSISPLGIVVLVAGESLEENVFLTIAPGSQHAVVTMGMLEEARRLIDQARNQ